MMRLFIGLPIPEDIGDILCRLQKGVPGARWRTKAQFHITLAFIGEVATPIASEIDAALDMVRQAPFELQLSGAGHFGGAEPHALYMGVADNPALMQLQGKVARAVARTGIQLERRTYLPHVTTAYLGATNLDRVMAFAQRHGLFQSPPFWADRFYMYRSHLNERGSQYEVVAEYPLVG